MKGRFRIVFDGGADPNPGRGYGSYVIERLDEPARLLERVRFDEEALTNNEAEYLTLIQALHRLIALSRCRGSSSVEIVGDSRLVVNQVSGEWRAGDPRMAALRSAVVDLLGRVGSHETRWQPREAIVAVLGH